jgi:hypothetical protein
MRITIIVKLLSVLLPFTFASSWATNDKCPETIKTTVNGRPCEDETSQHPCTSESEFDTMDAVHKFDSYDMTKEVLVILPPQLLSPRKLKTTKVAFITALPNNTLTHLKFVGNADPLKLRTILAHQGSSLQSLEFRRPEQVHEPFVADFDISILPSMAPNLSHLAVNVPRNGTWPLDTLRTIASLPHLESADIYMNIASECQQQRDPPTIDSHDCEGEERFQKPFVGKEGAEEMFAYMRQKKQVLSFSKVTFRVGDWTRKDDGPLYSPEWLDGKRVKVVCTADGHGGRDEGWCVVEAGENYWSNERYLGHFEY